MEPKYIITLREAINTGSGTTQMLEVKGYRVDLVDSGILHYDVDHGSGLLPVKNIAGIYPVKPKV